MKKIKVGILMFLASLSLTAKSFDYGRFGSSGHYFSCYAFGNQFPFPAMVATCRSRAIHGNPEYYCQNFALEMRDYMREAMRSLPPEYRYPIQIERSRTMQFPNYYQCSRETELEIRDIKSVLQDRAEQANQEDSDKGYQVEGVSIRQSDGPITLITIKDAQY